MTPFLIAAAVGSFACMMAVGGIQAFSLDRANRH
jgi:hypothetical protein